MVETSVDNATDSVSVSVVVNAPVIVGRHQEENVVFQGDDVKLECRANGIPEPGGCRK